MKKYYVYLITNTILNKQYVGSRISELENLSEDNYWGSSKYLNEAYKIYGKENFKKEILNTTYKDKNSMLNGESEYMLRYNTLEPYGYNRYIPNTCPGFHREGCKHTEKSKHQISVNTKERMKTIDMKAINGMRGKSNYYFWKQKFGEEIANKMQKDRDEKQSNSMLGKNKGKKRSNKQNKQRSENQKGKPHPQKKLKCPHCGHETITTNYNKSHGDKCRANPLYKQSSLLDFS